MNGIIITGHGHFATGLLSSIELIAGHHDYVEAVDFLEDYSVEQLNDCLSEANDRLKDCEGILYLCDMVGGTPFKTAVLSSSQIENAAVIGGTNLAMAIEAVLMKGSLPLAEVKDMIIRTGQDSIQHYQKKLRKPAEGSGL